MIASCALVAERYGAGLQRLKDMGYATFHTAIHSTLSKSLEDSRKQNAKIDILLEEYSDIKMNTTDNQQAINDFIDWVVEISECVNSNEWRGEDVMGMEKQSGDDTCQWVNPAEHLSYQVPQKPFEIFEEDFRKTAMDYLMFQKRIDVKTFGEKLMTTALYSSQVSIDDETVTVSMQKGGDGDDEN